MLRISPACGRLADCVEAPSPYTPLWVLSRQAPPLSTRVRPLHRHHDHEINGSSTRAHTAPRGMNPTPEAVCRRGRGGRRGWWAAYGHPLVGSGRERGWLGGGRSILWRDPLRGVGAVGEEMLSAAAPAAPHGLGLKPSPCLEVASGILLRPTIRGHLTTSRGPRDEALAPPRPPTVGTRARRGSETRSEWQSDDSVAVRACRPCTCRPTRPGRDVRGAVFDNVGSIVREETRQLGSQHCQGGLPRGVPWGEGASTLVSGRDNW